MTKRVAFLFCAAVLPALGSAAIGQEKTDARDGELLYNNACRTCHTLREGDNRLGPHLYGIVGRTMGEVPGFGYSSAMKGGGLVWDRSTLDRFIANPDEVVPGNAMKPYSGLASAEERAGIIGYLEQKAQK